MEEIKGVLYNTTTAAFFEREKGINEMKRNSKNDDDKEQPTCFFTSCFQCCHMLEDYLSRVRSAAYPTTALHGPQYQKRQRKQIEAYPLILDQKIVIEWLFVLEEDLHL